LDYPVKTLSQLRPILQGFRKAAGLTQAMMASKLGVTQQTYAQLEANPAAASLERLFKVLRVLNVGLTLSQTDARPEPDTAKAPRKTSSIAGKKTENW
jgi:HTH-type transcriptional regulator / antitoxin HipB